MYYTFNSQEEFDIWHSNLMDQLGYPKADGITTQYTKLEIKTNGELYAFVDEIYAEGLSVTDKPQDKPKK